MNVKRNWRETGLYWILCIISCGAIWLLRITITVAIRMAFENEWEKKRPKVKLPVNPYKHKKKGEQKTECGCPIIVDRIIPEGGFEVTIEHAPECSVFRHFTRGYQHTKR